MATHVHLVGSIGLDTVDDVYRAVGEYLGPYVQRVPDGEVGGRRSWIGWQWPALSSNPCLRVPEQKAGANTSPSGVTIPQLGLAPGVKPEDVRFGELGYSREARTSYIDFVRAREAGILPRNVRFQVCLPTPYAVVNANIALDVREALEPEYERAMLREVAKICAEIPHHDLAIQWDVCIEMVAFDGRWRIPRFAGIERAFGARFNRLSSSVPAGVQLGFHLCYGDWEGRHFIEPENTARMAELANLIASNAGRHVEFIHMPVPIARDDDAFYAPLEGLRLDNKTELYLGLVHAQDGIAGATKRMLMAKKYVHEFGIATECGFSRNRSPDLVREIFKIHASAAGNSAAG